MEIRGCFKSRIVRKKTHGDSHTLASMILKSYLEVNLANIKEAIAQLIEDLPNQGDRSVHKNAQSMES